MVGNKSERLEENKHKKPADYCSLCGHRPSQVIDHPRAHHLRLNGFLYESLKYLHFKQKPQGFPADYTLEDGKTINPKYLIKESNKS